VSFSSGSGLKNSSEPIPIKLFFLIFNLRLRHELLA
jgi:hypothetical protein